MKNYICIDGRKFILPESVMLNPMDENSLELLKDCLREAEQMFLDSHVRFATIKGRETFYVYLPAANSDWSQNIIKGCLEFVKKSKYEISFTASKEYAPFEDEHIVLQKWQLKNT